MTLLTNEVYRTYVDILHEELTPAFGCTEPIAVAYCAALARRTLGAMPEKVCIEASGNIIKNVKSVIVPNTEGQKGIPAAAAAGIVAGDPDQVLEVIAYVSEEEKKAIAEYLDQAEFTVRSLDEGEKLDIRITVEAGSDKAVTRISKNHSNVVYIEKNGQVLLSAGGEVSEAPVKHADRSLLTVENIVAFADQVKVEDVADVLERQISYNYAIAEEGIQNDWGANVGKVLLEVYGDDVRNRAKAMAAAGSDARMSGCALPVVINSGSGNQGSTVSVPVIVYAKELGCSHEKLLRALVISNLISIHIKSGIGPLSAFCGAVSAGCAAGCAITYLMGGHVKEISHTLVNSIAIVSGIVCDGAKPSCAGKIASSVDAGILGYEMYRKGQQFYAEDGIVSKGVEATIRNIARLGAKGMWQTDEEIIRIMTHCD